MNNKGFSLVELIIVIAIMAILAGALAPALLKYVAKSRRSSDVSNGQSVASAVDAAMTDEDASGFTDLPSKDAIKVSAAGTGAFGKALDNNLSGGIAKFDTAKTTKYAVAGAVGAQTYYWFKVTWDNTTQKSETQVWVAKDAEGCTDDTMVYPTVGAEMK